MSNKIPKEGNSKSLIFGGVTAFMAAISMLIFSIFTAHKLIFPVAPTSAETSYAASSEVGLNVKESIKIAVDKSSLALEDSSGNTQIAPEASGTLITGDVNVAVTTNAYGGYRLGIYTADSTTNMTHSNTSVSSAINSISTATGYDATNGLATLPGNTWGFRKYTEATENGGEGGTPTSASWSNWYGVGSSSSNMAIVDTKDVANSTYCDNLSQPVNESGCTSGSYDTYKIGFGANLTSSLPAGNYTNNIIFSAVTNEATTFLTFSPNVPASVTVTGSMAPKTILKGSTTTLPNDTTFRRIGYGVKGWALTSGATEVATITQPDLENPGSDPEHPNTTTVSLIPGATIDVDSLISAAGIPESTTGPIPLYAVWDNAYNINYVANNPEGTTVTGTMTPSTSVLGLDTTIPSTTYEVEGYNLIGWAFTADATEPASISTAGAKDLISGATFTTQQLITAAAAAGQSISTSNPGNITLYAIWEQDGYGEDTMQGWTGCSTLAANASVELTDARDGKTYTVKKLPDGKCWMMQNLTINGVELTPEDTNIADGNTYYLPKDGGAGSLTSSSTKDATTGYNFASGSDNQAMFKFRSKDTSYTNDSDTGYYNFYTATLGYSYYNDGKTSGTSPQDICPANWRMPRTTDSGTNVTAIDTTNDFTYLARTYSTSNWSGSSTGTSGSGYYSTNSTLMNSMYKSAASPLATATANNYAGFSYAGAWGGTNASASDVGSGGNYWSASIYDTNYGYLLSFNSSYVYPQINGIKLNGYAVRCISKLDGTMQDFDSNTLTNIGQTAKLKDVRDGKIYTVKKLQDGKVWMIDNLALGGDSPIELNSGNTNLPSGTTYYLPAAGYMNDKTASTTSGATAVNFNNSSYNQYFKVAIRNAGDAGDSDSSGNLVQYTGYYDFNTATMGFSYYDDGVSAGSSSKDICPAGWRLPWTSDAGTTRQGNAEFYTLALAYNNNSSVWTNYIAPGSTSTSKPYTTDATVRRNMIKEAEDSSTVAGSAGFNYAGTYYNASLRYVGSSGLYWSSSVSNSKRSYIFNFNTSRGVYPQSDNNKYDGNTVRCIAQ